MELKSEIHNKCVLLCNFPPKVTPKHSLNGAENTFDAILLNVIRLDNMIILEN